MGLKLWYLDSNAWLFHQWQQCKSWCINSLAPGRYKWTFRQVIFKLISVIGGWGNSCEIVIRWMLLELTEDKSTLVPVMAWCRQAASHYLSQCWPRYVSSYGVTRPQWVKGIVCHSLRDICSTSIKYRSWIVWNDAGLYHYNDVIMSGMASQITSLAIVYSTVKSGTDHHLMTSSCVREGEGNFPVFRCCFCRVLWPT